jgi:hypothetical protein
MLPNWWPSNKKASASQMMAFNRISLPMTD